MSTDTSNLIAALKAKIAEQNTSFYSDAACSFPIRTFLTLVNKAQRECVIDYMEGARALHYWLTSDSKYPLTSSFSTEELAELNKPNHLLGSYHLNELTKIMSPSLNNPSYLSDSARIHKLMFYELLAMAAGTTGAQQS